MVLDIVKTFVVNAPPVTVWNFLTDLPRVVHCMPGAAIGDPTGDGDHADSMTVKVASVISTHEGRISFGGLDRDALGSDDSGIGLRGGEGGADMEMTSTITELGPRVTEVTVASRVTVKGMLVHMQQETVDGVIDQMFQIFSRRMRAELEPPSHSAEQEPAAPQEEPWHASASHLAARASWRAAAADLRGSGRAALDTVTAPAFWVAVTAIAAVLYLLFG